MEKQKRERPKKPAGHVGRWNIYGDVSRAEKLAAERDGTSQVDVGSFNQVAGQKGAGIPKRDGHRNHHILPQLRLI